MGYEYWNLLFRASCWCHPLLTTYNIITSAVPFQYNILFLTKILARYEKRNFNKAKLWTTYSNWYHFNISLPYKTIEMDHYFISGNFLTYRCSLERRSFYHIPFSFKKTLVIHKVLCQYLYLWQEGNFNYKTASEAQFNLERVNHSESKSLLQTLLDLKITELKNTKLKQSKEKY